MRSRRRNCESALGSPLSSSTSDVHIARSLNAPSRSSVLTEGHEIGRLLVVSAVRGGESLSRPVALPSEWLASLHERYRERQDRIKLLEPMSRRREASKVGVESSEDLASKRGFGRWSASQTGCRRARPTLEMAAAVVKTTRRKAPGRQIQLSPSESTLGNGKGRTKDEPEAVEIDRRRRSRGREEDRALEEATDDLQESDQRYRGSEGRGARWQRLTLRR